MTDSTQPPERLPSVLFRADQVRRLDHIAIEEEGIPGIALMNRAGEFAYRIIRAQWPAARRLAVLAGTGNNGGDGYVIARLAQADGLAVRVLQFGGGERIRADAAMSRDAYLGLGGRIEPWQGLPQDADLFVDALLGTGLERAVEGGWADAVGSLNAQCHPVVSVDIPSGLHSDTGRILGAAVRASATVSFIGLKQGLFIGAGPDCRGRLHFSDLGLPASLLARETAAARRIDWAGCAGALGPRRRTAHKGDFGHLLILGGAPGMSGAVRLAGEAALRAGAGLVSIATHPKHADLLNLTRPELMVSGVEDETDLAPLVERADVVAVGPGLGRTAWGQALWLRAAQVDRPLVVDADALNALAAAPVRRSDWILTPHPGEAARLLGVSAAEIESDRPGAVRELQRRYGGTVVLKGAGTLILGAGPQSMAVCSEGNPGMATAGSGDVLTGVIAALRGQGLDAGQAAQVGVCLHAAAGDRAARQGEQGLVAGDIVRVLRQVINGFGAG